MTSAESSVAALIVAYFPDEAFYEQLPEIAATVRLLAIYDNGGLDRDRVANLASNIEVIGDGRNSGIAAALNRGCVWARSRPENYQWLITLDQDSLPTPGMWEQMLGTALSTFPVESIGLISPSYQPGASIEKLSFRHGFGRSDPRNTADCGRVWITMTSGNILRLQVHERVGGFDEDYYIDQVDHEYCLRLNAADYVVCEVPAAVLHHAVGAVLETRRFGRVWRVSSHNPARLRYQTRNLLYVIKRHAHLAPVVISKLAYEYLYRTLRLQILLPRSQAAALRVSIAGGISDALARRRGSLAPEQHQP